MDKNLAFQNYKNWAKTQQVSLADLFPTIQKTTIYPIDLSTTNSLVKTEAEFNNPDAFQSKLDVIQYENSNKIITGGYLEKRALYTSDIYNSSNSDEKRNIHLGVDFWLPKNTPVHAIFNGEIVFSHHQKDEKGYGGFVVLKHKETNIEFYTLYGHLSKNSVANFKKGDIIKKNKEIGVLGNYKENGNWIPHLHFQIMLDLLNYQNDFPGVVLESELDYWKKICPNPNLLFKLPDLN